jgi:phage-related protein
MTWPVTYYRDRAGFEPANVFIDGIEPASHRAMVDDYIERLAIFGPDLNFPSCSHVRGDIWELRPDGGRTHYRVLYFRTRNVFVLLHAFVKPDGPIAEREIGIARTGWTMCARGWARSRGAPRVRSATLRRSS